MPEGIVLNPTFKVTTGSLPSSRKIHVPGRLYPELRVAMREVDLAPSSGEPAVRIYDASGPYSDPDVHIEIRRGLTPLRLPWIEARRDVEAYDGRPVRPEDDGGKVGGPANLAEYPLASRRQPLRAKDGKAVTQMAYARAGIVTPEM